MKTYGLFDRNMQQKSPAKTSVNVHKNGYFRFNKYIFKNMEENYV